MRTFPCGHAELENDTEVGSIGTSVSKQFLFLTAKCHAHGDIKRIYTDVMITPAHWVYNVRHFQKVKVKVHTLDIAPLRSESPPQKRSGMARVLKGFHSFTRTPTRSSAIGMSHTCLCLPSRSWYLFTDP